MASQVKWWFNGAGLAKSVKKEAQKGVMRCAGIVMREAKMSMKKGGRQKSRNGKRPRGIPSPVGTPPHAQLSTLKNSIQAEMTSSGSALVGPTALASYGAVHEHSKKFPRKFMRPALLKSVKQFPKEFANMPITCPQGRA